MKRLKLKRWIAVLVVALMAMTKLSGFAALADGGDGSDDSGNESLYSFGSEEGNSLMNPDAPEEMREGTDDNPLGHGDDEFVPTYEIDLHNMFLYYSQGGNNNTKNAAVYEQYKGDGTTRLTDEENWLSIDSNDIGSVFGTEYASCYIVQAQAFDLYNLNRDTGIAYLGVRKANGNVNAVLWVYDTINNCVSDIITLGNMNFISDAGFNGTDLMTLKNFLALTAGDYDGNGKDTIVVYAATDGTPVLRAFQASMDDSSNKLKLNATTGASPELTSLKGMLHPVYLNNWSGFQISETVLNDWLFTC